MFWTCGFAPRDLHTLPLERATHAWRVRGMASNEAQVEFITTDADSCDVFVDGPLGAA